MKSFLPVITGDTKLLILGSFPGQLSLEKCEYYGNSKNHFWELISSYLQTPVPAQYQDKITMLMRNRIGLWDTIASCKRTGSSDSAITEPVLNTLCELFVNSVSLKTVLCNGSTSFKLACQNCRNKRLFKKTICSSTNAAISYDAFVCEQYNVLFLRLPSTSPIPTQHYKTITDKKPCWHAAIAYALCDT